MYKNLKIILLFIILIIILGIIYVNNLNKLNYNEHLTMLHNINNNKINRNKINDLKYKINNIKNSENYKNIINNSFILDEKINLELPSKSKYNSIIPLNIYQTWYTKDFDSLPPLMKNNILFIKEQNPEFNYYLFDDNDCYKFIKKNFDKDVANAYNILIPGAYKADLWRYCILYIKGGIYLDIKYKPINNFKFISLTEKEHWVLDIDNYGIYNAMIVVEPKNKILLKAINQIVKNVKDNYYGRSSLDVTGPGLLSQYFTRDEKDKFDMKHTFYISHDNRYIIYNDYYILKSYDGYLKEFDKYKKTDHYSKLWTEKRIYNR